MELGKDIELGKYVASGLVVFDLRRRTLKWSQVRGAKDLLHIKCQGAAQRPACVWQPVSCRELPPLWSPTAEVGDSGGCLAPQAH